jgi:N-acetylglucosaminylphosphatidylinositol deacetylase
MDDIIEWLESDDIFLIKYGFVIANTFTLIFLYLIKRFRPSKKKDDDEIKNILFVTAHPDDEAMFFIPTI